MLLVAALQTTLARSNTIVEMRQHCGTLPHHAEAAAGASIASANGAPSAAPVNFQVCFSKRHFSLLFSSCFLDFRTKRVEPPGRHPVPCVDNTHPGFAGLTDVEARRKGEELSREWIRFKKSLIESEGSKIMAFVPLVTFTKAVLHDGAAVGAEYTADEFLRNRKTALTLHQDLCKGSVNAPMVLIGPYPVSTVSLNWHETSGLDLVGKAVLAALGETARRRGVGLVPEVRHRSMAEALVWSTYMSRSFYALCTTILQAVLLLHGIDDDCADDAVAVDGDDVVAVDTTLEDDAEADVGAGTPPPPPCSVSSGFVKQLQYVFKFAQRGLVMMSSAGRNYCNELHPLAIAIVVGGSVKTVAAAFSTIGALTEPLHRS